MEQATKITVPILRKGETCLGSEEVTIKCLPAGIEIALPGHSTFDAPEGPPIFLEHYNGRFQLVVWGDVNQEDPTHMIDMSGARESELAE